MNDKRYTIYGNSNDLDGIQEAVDLVKENEKLNNIINEIEKYIIDFKEDYGNNEFQPNAKVYIYWKDLIDKIKELKGADK